uniref:Uncharacterized protein n=1 Tax=Physcomitrium patens TaxID=3218 RepID=A0A2K1K9T6_PHYPA|nr:hypothetical protein PHYPA_009726 [Physcomitrium patens]
MTCTCNESIKRYLDSHSLEILDVETSNIIY